MKTATIYARVSSTGDRQDTARQVEDLTAYAQRNELEVVKVFTEKLSGLKKRLRSTAPLCYIVEALRGRLAIVPEETPDDPHCQFIEFE